ncbi:MAG: ferredoxin-type protein NapG, partial [Gammaproteobacteria bacterium]|nr:ferredoxin-type protein NapG [Gammaproteobacteria bacterium]
MSDSLYTRAERPTRRSAGRRRFLSDTAKTGCGVLLAGLGIGSYARQSAALPAQALRPPGARAENDFLGACIRCGLCVRDCPFDTLKLATVNDEVAPGTPYFTAREIPCEMCDDIPCVLACPSNALDPALTEIDDAKMGLAVLVDEETCLNFQGLRCDVCYRQCPLIGEAITLELRHNSRSNMHALFIPTVRSEACTGCGKCEQVCVLPEAAIKVLPVTVAKGMSADHYRWGWEEKEEAGGSLVSPDPRHRYNLPEGYDYDI